MFISNTTEQSFGLDISDLSLKIVQLEKIKNDINIQAIGQINLPKGIIDNGIIKDKEIFLENLKKLINKPKYGYLKTNNVVACLPETKTYIKLIEINKTPNKIEDIIETEIEKNVPISINEAYYDWQIISSFENKDIVLVGVAPKDIVKEYIDVLKSAGLSISALEIESTAICRSLLLEESPKPEENSSENYCILDIGAQRSGLIIYSKNSIVMSVSIPISGNEATEKISETLEINKDQAEKAKIVCGLDKNKAQGVINKILSSMINDLISKTKRSIDFYNDNHKDYGPINKIILCGGGSNIKELNKIIDNSIKIKTIHGNPLVHLNPKSIETFKNIEKKIDIKDKKINKEKISSSENLNLSYTTAIGLALRDIFIKDN